MVQSKYNNNYFFNMPADLVCAEVLLKKIIIKKRKKVVTAPVRLVAP